MVCTLLPDSHSTWERASRRWMLCPPSSLWKFSVGRQYLAGVKRMVSFKESYSLFRFFPYIPDMGYGDELQDRGQRYFPWARHLQVVGQHHTFSLGVSKQRRLLSRALSAQSLHPTIRLWSSVCWKSKLSTWEHRELDRSCQGLEALHS